MKRTMDEKIYCSLIAKFSSLDSLPPSWLCSRSPPSGTVLGVFYADVFFLYVWVLRGHILRERAHVQMGSVARIALICRKQLHKPIHDTVRFRRARLLTLCTNSFFASRFRSSLLIYSMYVNQIHFANTIQVSIVFTDTTGFQSCARLSSSIGRKCTGQSFLWLLLFCVFFCLFLLLFAKLESYIIQSCHVFSFVTIYYLLLLLIIH